MSEAFLLLHIGDALTIDEVEYIATGVMTLCESGLRDGDDWREWLLAPKGCPAEDAIRMRLHRWLSYEPHTGLMLWRPIAPPDGCTPDALSPGARLKHGKLQYTVEDRYRMTTDMVVGDVGGDASLGETFEAADLRCGPEWMSIEWNARGLDATLGKRCSDHALLAWSRAAGGPLSARVGDRTPETGNHTTVATPSTRPDGRIGDWMGGLLIGGSLLALLLGSCETKCGTGYDRQGNPYDTCSNGIRTHGGRSFGGWGGK